MSDDRSLKYWKNGGRRDFWIKSADVIEKFVANHDLRKLNERELIPHRLAGEMAADSMTMFAGVQKTAAAGHTIPDDIWDFIRGIYGGMRVPHLHFQGNVYLLNDRQWRDFSGQVLESLNKKLSAAQAVAFDDVIDVAEVVNRMP